MPLKITTKRLDKEVEVSIEDEINHLGIKFTTSDFTTDEGLTKILNVIADYINQNYTCLHQKHDRRITFAK